MRAGAQLAHSGGGGDLRGGASGRRGRDLRGRFSEPRWAPPPPPNWDCDSDCPGLRAATRKEGGRAWVPTPATLSPAPLADFHVNVQPRCPGLGLFTFLGTVVSEKKVLYAVKCSRRLYAGRVWPRKVGLRIFRASNRWEKSVAFTHTRVHTPTGSHAHSPVHADP